MRKRPASGQQREAGECCQGCEGCHVRVDLLQATQHRLRVVHGRGCERTSAHTCTALNGCRLQPVRRRRRASWRAAAMLHLRLASCGKVPNLCGTRGSPTTSRRVRLMRPLTAALSASLDAWSKIGRAGVGAVRAGFSEARRPSRCSPKRCASALAPRSTLDSSLRVRMLDVLNWALGVHYKQWRCAQKKHRQ